MPGPEANSAAAQRREPVSDLISSERGSLDVFFQPRNVALIGATETAGSVGRSVLWNLIRSPFGGTVFPVNPKRLGVLGVKAYPRVGDVPDTVDLAVIATPASTVPGVIGECVAAGVKGAVIISAGFRETGAAGAALEQQVLDQARRGRMRIIGPNCLGVMSPLTGLNATFANAMARPGSVGFISQSGALCTAILDWSLRELVGFSAFVSVGSMLDVGWGDLIQHLGDDPRTGSIVIYMESIGDARSFISAAREVAFRKPIIVIKAGRSEAAAKAAASHTGALAGSDDVLEAAFRRSGVLRVNDISDLFYMSEVLARQPRPKGPRLAIVTNAGGPGVLATDELIAQGGELAPLSPETVAELNQFLPHHWSHRNPIDIIGDAEPERYAKTLGVVTRDTTSDGLLAVLTPQGVSDPTLVAEQIKKFARTEGMPVLASWMGGADVTAGERILHQAGIPTFPYPDLAARAFCYMWRYSYNLRSLYETPAATVDVGASAAGRDAARAFISAAREKGRTILSEADSKHLLSLYGVPVLETVVALDEEQAVAAAARLKYPVVVKLHSETITHKSDVGGVRLNLADAESVRQAYHAIEAAVSPKDFLGVTVQPMLTLEGYELILGATTDPQFGPVLLFGTGGRLVEVYGDRALALPPLNTTLARRMVEQTKIGTALKGVRGRKPIDMAELERLLVRFSRLVIEQPWIREIDVNPLMASPDRLIAIDARVILHGPGTAEAQLPRPAIRPYPNQYAGEFRMKDGTAIVIRPISPEDEPLMVEFHGKLSQRSVYFRYFYAMQLDQRVAHERLTRICFIDYDREMALVAERRDALTGAREILGVGRLTKLRGLTFSTPEDAEFAIIISDTSQRRGLGAELLRRLITVAREEKLRRIVGDILPENHAMQTICERLGFRLQYSPEDSVIKAELLLEPR